MYIFSFSKINQIVEKFFIQTMPTFCTESPCPREDMVFCQVNYAPQTAHAFALFDLQRQLSNHHGHFKIYSREPQPVIKSVVCPYYLCNYC